MKVWILGFFAWRTASQQRSMSSRAERERPATMVFVTALATSRTDSNSSFDAMGKPASMTSTPSFSS